MLIVVTPLVSETGVLTWGVVFTFLEKTLWEMMYNIPLPLLQKFPLIPSFCHAQLSWQF